MWGGTNTNNNTSNNNTSNSNNNNSQWNQFGGFNQNNQQQNANAPSPFGIATTPANNNTNNATTSTTTAAGGGGFNSSPFGGFNQQPQQQQQQQQPGIGIGIGGGFNAPSLSSPFGAPASVNANNSPFGGSGGGGTATGFGSASSGFGIPVATTTTTAGAVPASPFGGGFGTTGGGGAGGFGSLNMQNANNNTNSPFGNTTTTAAASTTPFGGGSGGLGSTFGGGSGPATTTANNNSPFAANPSPFSSIPSSVPANTSSNPFGSGGANANTSGLFGAPASKLAQQNLNVNASPFAPATAMPSPFAPSLSSPFGGGNAAATKLGGEKKEAQTQNQSTFGGGLMGGGSFNDVKTTASGLKIPTPRTQIGGGGGGLAATGIAPAATATPSFSPFLSGGGTKASAPPLPKTAPFGGSMQGSSLFGKTPPPKKQMKMTASAIDDFGDDLHKATSERHITGTCNEMCPTSELQRRSEEGDLELFERVDGSNRNKTSVGLCCKKYTRIVDGVQPDMVRTKFGLAKTMTHLWRILDERPEAFVVKSKFLWDRLRSVRQDLSLQQMYDAFAASALQQMVRYAIISEHELCEDAATAISPDGHNSHLNVEQLTKTLTTLRHIYDDHRAKQQALPLDHEAEMFALQLLLRIDSHGRYSVSTHEMLGDLRSARNAILNHALVNFALECRSAYIDVNCAKFFKLVEKANYVQKCVLHKYFVKMRSKTLERFNQSMAKGPFPIKELARIFRASETETEALCLHHGLSVVLHREDGKCVEFRTTTFSHPSEDFETKKSPLVRTNINHKYRQFIVRHDEIASEGKVTEQLPVGQQQQLQPQQQQLQQQQQQQQFPELTKKQKEAQELREKIQRVEAEQKRAKAAIEAKKAEEARLALEATKREEEARAKAEACLLYTSPSPRDS